MTRNNVADTVRIVLSAAILAAGAPAQASQGDREGTRRVADSDLTTVLLTRLARDEAVAAHRVTVGVDEGIVTLGGQVDDLLTERRAIAIARSTRGVRSVIDRMDVDPPVDRSDAEIANELRAALAVDPATDHYEIAVAVSDGAATLSGTVDSAAERGIALDVARGVRGVTEVVDDLAVAAVDARPDEDIVADVAQRLAYDVRVDARDVTVNSRDGVVELTGTVRSAQEKQLATELALVAGVERVAHEDLEVSLEASDDRAAPRPKQTRSRAAVLAAVADAMRHDARISAPYPEVSMRRGVVYLRGTVDDLVARRAALEDAENTVGVAEVISLIRVEPVENLPDAEIRAAIEAALERDPLLEPHALRVEVRAGKVHLYGLVDTWAQRVRAEEVAGRPVGVRAVDNHLDVRLGTPLDRDALRAEVRRELAWSTLVDVSDVRIEVRADDVVLRGEVDDWAAWRAADRIARRESTRPVTNRLKVEGIGVPARRWRR